MVTLKSETIFADSDDNVSLEIKTQKLVKEIKKLERSRFNFIIGWILGTLTSMFLGYYINKFDVIGFESIASHYFFWGAVLIGAGLTIFEYFKKLEKKLEKMVELVLLLKSKT